MVQLAHHAHHPAIVERAVGAHGHLRGLAIGALGQGGHADLALDRAVGGLTQRPGVARRSFEVTAGGGEVRLFSALKKQGVDEVATTLYQWMHA